MALMNPEVKWISSPEKSSSEESKSLLSSDSRNDSFKASTGRKSATKQIVLYFGICFLCVANLVQFLLLHPDWNTKSAPRYQPEFPVEKLIIDRNKSWEVGSNAETDALWNTGVPGITGWVQIEDARSYDLPHGIPSLDKATSEVYITTWGHQHHCLKTLRKEFSKLISGKSKFVGADAYGNGLDKESSGKLAHVMHCFDYLRQTTTCQSDLTLEGLGKDSTETMLEIDGYGVEHECKSFVAVGQWLVAHSPVGESFQDIEL